MNNLYIYVDTKIVPKNETTPNSVYIFVKKTTKNKMYREFSVANVGKSLCKCREIT